MSEIIGVDPDRAFGLQEEIIKKTRLAYKNNDVQFVDALEALTKANYQQREVFIEEVLKRKSSEKSFVVGEVFQHRNKKLKLCYFYVNFKNWLWLPAQERVMFINAFGQNNLKEYVLTKNMKDTSIQNANSSTPVTEDQFWEMVYLLIIEPKLGKKILKYFLRKDKVYVFHVKLDSGNVVAVFVYWDDGEWNFDARGFDSDVWGIEGYVFLFPATIGN